MIQHQILNLVLNGSLNDYLAFKKFTRVESNLTNLKSVDNSGVPV